MPTTEITPPTSPSQASKRLSIRPLLIGCVLVVVIALVALTRGSKPNAATESFPESTAGEATSDSAIHVSVVRAGQVAAPETFARYRGTVQSRRESRLGFRRSGRVHRVLVNEGDVVEAGDVLAELDVSDLNAQREQAHAQRSSARAALSEAVAGPRKQTINAAIADVNRFTAELRSAEADFVRERTLQRRGAGTEQGYDSARFAVDRFKASLESSQARLKELQEGTRPEQLEAAKAAVAVAEAAVSRIDVDLADSRIIAPYDGQIAARMIDEGTIVNPDAITLHIIEAPPLEARFGLPDFVAATVQPRDIALVELADRKVDATVIRIHPSLDLKTRTRAVDVQFAPDANLIPGQTVSLKVPNRDREPPDESEVRFWVPTSALVRGSRGLWSVMVAVPNQSGRTETANAERRDIRVMQTSGELSQVTGMIQRGEAIVSEGTHRIGPGITVIVAEDAGRTKRLAVFENTSQP